MACATCIKGLVKTTGKVCTDCNGGGVCKIQDPLGVIDRVRVINAQIQTIKDRNK